MVLILNKKACVFLMSHRFKKNPVLKLLDRTVYMLIIFISLL